MKNLKIFMNSRVVVTGHTGFKGSWLTAWLKQLGANVMGISLNSPTNPSHFEVSKIKLGIKDVRIDIRDRAKLEKQIKNDSSKQSQLKDLESRKRNGKNMQKML